MEVRCEKRRLAETEEERRRCAVVQWSPLGKSGSELLSLLLVKRLSAATTLDRLIS